MTRSNTDLYSRVTSEIVTALEGEIRPWIQPWCAGHAAGSLVRPLRCNGVPYRGINVIVLWLNSLLNAYESPFWMTYRQAKELGGQVRRGEKGATIVYSDTFTKRSTGDGQEEIEERIPFLKAYTVFNAEQVDALPDRFRALPLTPLTPTERFERADNFVEATKATIRHGGSGAFYMPQTDIIALPHLDRFRNAESYYATLLHELTHWTGHSSRLDREFNSQRFGSDTYAMEELVAEIGAAFLCADLSIATEIRDDHASYIASWLRVLKRDQKAIFTAAAHAELAAGYLHKLQT